MDQFGLTESEKKINLHWYNHALFRNMMFFLDIVWEINMLTETVVVMENQNEPERGGKEYPYEDFFRDYLERRIVDDEQEIFKKYLTFENLQELTQEVCFDIHIRIKGGEGELHQVVLTPAFDEQRNLYCVYLGARNLQSEVRELKDNIKLRSSNEKLKRTLSQEQQYRLASMSGALLIYNINLTRNLIEEEFYEIIDGKRIPMIELIGLSVPCDFDEFSKRWCEAKVFEESREAFLKMYNRQSMLDAYERGERHLEIEFDTVLGRNIPVTLRSTAFLVEDSLSGDILALVHGKDISSQREEEKRQREALRDAYEAANNASAAKTDFLMRMSHDIRTPMNAIVGMTAIAQKNLDNIERVADCLKKISVSGEYLLALLGEVLDMSKIESGKVELQEKKFNLSDFIDTILAICKVQVKEKRQDLSVVMNGIKHEHVFGDDKRLQQAFMNLMDNSIKYTPQGGKINLIITEKETNRPHVACFEFVFEDSGIGIDESFLPHLFEPFSRSDDLRVAKVQGTGLGLAIAKNLIQMMNGTIEVQSRLNEGTRMSATVFLRLQDETDEVNFREVFREPFLIIDEDENTGESVCGILVELGIKGEWVRTAKEAPAKIAEKQKAGSNYCAVICSWEQCRETEADVAKEIYSLLGPSVPIVISTGKTWPDGEFDAESAGVTAYIGKPVSKSRMVHLLKTLAGHAKRNEKRPVDRLEEKDYKGRRVLLAEDNELNAEIAKEILEMAGLEVEHVWDGKAAVDRATDVPDGYYDIIFMDIQMPVMNGYEATKAIRGMGRQYLNEVPIFAMSANAFAEDVQKSKASGMNDHIAKPIDLQRIEQVLNQFLPEAGK